MSGAWVESRAFSTRSWSADGPSTSTANALADTAVLAAPDQTLLQTHHAAAARGLGPGRDIIVELEGRRPFLVRVGEHADVVERVVAEKRAQLVDIGLGFAGEADDERGAERDAGDPLANAREEPVVGLARAGALHALEHGVRRMLQRQIDVVADLVALRHRRERVFVNRRRVQIEEADPLEAVDRVQFAQQASEGAALVAVDAVEGRVLRDEQELFDAARGQRARFADDRVARPAPVLAAQRRDDAERALVVAALGDLDVRVVPRRGQEARRVGVVDVGRQRASTVLGANSRVLDDPQPGLAEERLER